MKIDQSREFNSIVRQKIKTRKKYYIIIRSTVFMVLTIFISIQSSLLIEEDRMNSLWAEYQSEIALYEWEYLPDVDDIDSFVYLIDELDMDELLTVFNDDYYELESFNTN